MKQSILVLFFLLGVCFLGTQCSRNEDDYYGGGGGSNGYAFEVDSFSVWLSIHNQIDSIFFDSTALLDTPAIQDLFFHTNVLGVQEVGGFGAVDPMQPRLLFAAYAIDEPPPFELEGVKDIEITCTQNLRTEHAFFEAGANLKGLFQCKNLLEEQEWQNAQEYFLYGRGADEMEHTSLNLSATLNTTLDCDFTISFIGPSGSRVSAKSVRVVAKG